MVSYALDIENQRIASAMLELGISKDELITKKLEDFAGFNVTPEIQKLRYEHYAKLLKNTVNEIRELLKKRHASMLPGEYKVTTTESVEEVTYESNKNISQELNRFPPKQREILINTLTSFDLIKLPKKEKPKALKQNKSEKNLDSVTNKKNYKEMFKKHQDLQIMNINSLKKEQKQLQIDLYNKTAKSMKEHELREKNYENFRKILAKEREEMHIKKKESIDMRKLSFEQLSDNDIAQRLERKLSFEQLSDNDIAQRLERFDKKIHKSEELRIEAIMNKIQKTVTLREASERVEMRYKEKSKSNELELFNKLVDKQNKVKTARERNEEKIHNKMQKTKEEFEKRHQIALERIRSAENDLLYNAKKMENQMKASQKIVQDRKKKLYEDFEIKKELNKLKDYECLLKVQRAKRKFDYKMSKKLEKALEQNDRINEMKIAKEKEAYNNRESAIKAMIEKEKLFEAVAVIWKSPRSKTAQEKIKSLNIRSIEASISGADE
ncbi:hypothetical protein SteCoe_34575 [Stentor coeruleus]|uniref:Uncharacterized protein n=1 Tax=Stentor coeruleus TaxID=5963 RepID=A0A1R2AU97_9CILI|nr:hypothetical protein SteCoe_34575 [Stentor coeruleus]